MHGQCRLSELGLPFESGALGQPHAQRLGDVKLLATLSSVRELQIGNFDGSW
jgi:hypothetical protein